MRELACRVQNRLAIKLQDNLSQSVGVGHNEACGCNSEVVIQERNSVWNLSCFRTNFTSDTGRLSSCNRQKMSQLLTLEAKLERADSTTPWGFRMQGGKDFSAPFTINRVAPGSLAAKCGLQQGDIIKRIGNVDCDQLKHKDAQDAIVHYGNKLDLLLQRASFTHTPQYDIYSSSSAPTSYQAPPPAAPSPVSSSTPNQSLYNKSAKPFGATANKAPTPYGSSGVSGITQQTQNLNIGSSLAQKYADVEQEEKPSQVQSRSFKFLQDTLNSGQEPPKALRPLDPNRRSPSPGIVAEKGTSGIVQAKLAFATVTPQQFNTPVGLYSKEIVEKQTGLLQTEQGSGDEADTVNKEYDSEGRRIYHPSETFRLILEEENHVPAKEEKNHEPEHSRTFKKLQTQLGEAPPSAPKLTSSATKPGVWTPTGQPGQASGAKPFTPTIKPPPPPPSGPISAPSKPTGVGAVRGKIGDAVMRSGDVPAGGRIPVCASCGSPIRGPFVMAMGKSWCPDHFVCQNPRCGIRLIEIGFVEEGGNLYCEKDYELYFAPHCAKCDKAIVGECVNALQKTFHPACFVCHHCKQPIAGGQFHLEDGNPYCENDWRQMFQTMCSACNFPIEPGDRWVEALSNNYHSECFNCSTCQVNLEGQPFYAKGGKPYCKKHAR